MSEREQVRAMFSRIARRYDFLNHALSLGIDRRWRRALVDAARVVSGQSAVDACSGTGDVALALADVGVRVIGVDFTHPMLARAEVKRRSRAGRVVFVHGDALALPIGDASVDLCTIAFGIRNVADRLAALREMARVVRPGGRVLVLEFSLPPGRLLGMLYRFYFTRVLPRIGRLVSSDVEAYSYLPRTVLAWPTPAVFEREMSAVGFERCGHRLLTQGIACLHWGEVPLGRRVEQAA